MKRLPILILAICLLPLEQNSALAVYLPQTGQTSSYATGDDGNLRAGVAWPSPRYSDNGDGTISDTLTGLMWLKDANCFGAQSWVGGLDTVSAFNANPESYVCQDYTASYNDWRMPNINELATFWTIVPGGVTFPAMLQGLGFTRVQTGYYLSSTMNAGNPYYPWGIYFGGNSYVTSSGGEFLWPVRGTGDGPARVWRTGAEKCYAQYGAECVCGAADCPAGQDGHLRAGEPWPSPRLVDNLNDTVTDNLTGLMWLKDANCMATNYPAFDADEPPADGKVTWQHALDFVAQMNAGAYPLCSAGYQDWRLPNVVEMHSLNDFSQGVTYPEPPLPGGHPFGNVDANSYFHTSTAQNAFSSILWGAFGMWFYSPPTQPYQVWPVRYARSYTTADLSVSQSDTPDPVARSQQITYTVTVRNNGPYQATGATLSDTLPAGSAFISATASQGSCSQAGGVVSCSIGAMNVTATVTVEIVVTAPASKGTISNTATASSATTDHDPSNNSSTIQTSVKAVWYVDGSRPASGSGTLWGQALKTIPEAVTAAAAGDEIWVKEGSFTLTATINVSKAVALYGGFAGNETTLAQRDWAHHTTTINGNNAVMCMKISAAATVDGLAVTSCRNTNSWPDENGGAVSIASSSVTIANCTVSNSSTQNGGGGGIGTTFGLSSITIRDSTLTGNTSAYYGGGIYLTGTNNAIRRCTITGNLSLQNGGGGIYADPGNTGQLEISHSVVSGNRAQNSNSSGGGISIYGYGTAVPFISNCLVYDNQAAATAGGIAIGGSGSPGSLAVIQGSTIANNRLTDPLGYVQGSAFSFIYTEVRVADSIVWGNQLHNGAYTNQILLQSGGSLTPSYSDIQDSWWGALSGSHDINLDPHFMDPTAGDFRLQSSSPCIDRGTNTPPYPLPAADLTGGPRILDSDSNGIAIIDMGAYEYSDISPPSGSFAINGGAAYTNSTAVNLAITASDGSLPIQVCISNLNTGSCPGTWKALNSPEPWTLDPSSGDGIRTVYVWLRDGLGNTSITPLSSSISLDATPPSNGRLFLTEDDGKIAQSWSGFTDNVGSGIASYRMVYSTEGMPVDCGGTAVYTGSNSSWIHSGLTNGIIHYYRICALDIVGNISSGSTAQGLPAGSAARIDGPAPTPYSTIQDAYNEAETGATIQTRSTTFVETLSFDRAITVFLKGGYDPYYAGRSTYSHIFGSLKVSRGSVKASRVIVRPGL